jgi:methyl-accepting chemotaxis protein
VNLLAADKSFKLLFWLACLLLGALCSLGALLYLAWAGLVGALATAAVVATACAVIFLAPVPLLLWLLGRSIRGHVDAGVRSRQEIEDLSNSIINLLNGVDRLSQKDLTVRLEIPDGAAAPIADSLNQLADEITRVLQGVARVSSEISHFRELVKRHSDKVIDLAAMERDEVNRANSDVTAASDLMIKIAELAKTCGAAADAAATTTHTAKDTVVGTVRGITSIREVIRETEKRIKRLGERSQEISSAVSLINNIAERTHILALNAAIHAASTGEAGRGFAVIADEVQRLAESARESTGVISSLVSNIQTETSETVTVMNNVIGEVVLGTRLAEQAGEQMEETLSRTNDLVDIVQQIAAKSDQQAKIATLITERTKAIKDCTQKTNQELQDQSQYADKLVEYSTMLVDAIGVFKLPGAPPGTGR